MRDRVSTINPLFHACSPANIFWLIVPVIVNAINRQLWRWSSANIFNKGLETPTPSFAYTNASSAVIRVRRMFGIMAALFHGSPHRMFRHCAHSMCTFARLTSAGRRCAGAKIADKYFSFATTNTSAQQIPQAITPTGFTDNSPMSHCSFR